MDTRGPLTINMAAIRVSGVGAIGMAAVVAAMVIEIPAARWLFFGGLIAGAIAAGIVIRMRRDHVLGTPGDDLPMTLGLEQPAGSRFARHHDESTERRGLPRLAVSC